MIVGDILLVPVLPLEDKPCNGTLQEVGSEPTQRRVAVAGVKRYSR